MEDIFKFLLIAAVVIIGIVRQSKKEAKKSADGNPPMPTPQTTFPSSDNRDEQTTYGGFIPEGPKLKADTLASKKKASPKYSDTIKQTSFTSIPEPQELEEPSEYSINSAEEARRAIVWSEILQRKY